MLAQPGQALVHREFAEEGCLRSLHGEDHGVLQIWVPPTHMPALYRSCFGPASVRFFRGLPRAFLQSPRGPTAEGCGAGNEHGESAWPDDESRLSAEDAAGHS